MWLVAAVAAVLAGLVVVVASLAESDGRTAPSRVGPVSPEELRSVRLPLVWRGYDPGHVDALLARAATALEDAQRYGTSTPSEGGALPNFIADTFASEPDDERVHGPLREELEDAGGDGARGLDR